MKRGETERERETEKDGLLVLSLLSDAVGVKRLISLKPVGLPGTSRYFPYNIRGIRQRPL